MLDFGTPAMQQHGAPPLPPPPPQQPHGVGDDAPRYGHDVIADPRSRRKAGLPARYRRGRFLGKGGFARVYEVRDMETQEIFAAKIVAKASVAKPRAQAKLQSEISIHSSLTHDTVVKMYDYFDDAEYVYIILELCPNQTLNEFMRRRPNKRLSEPEAMFYLYDLIICLKYLHKRRVIHRDLKLGNLFLDAAARLKVGDFGLAAQLEYDEEKKRTICGTPNYIAPEIIEGKQGHSYEVDVWSLGVILYTMLIGKPPFDTSDVKTTYRRIRYNQFSFPEGVPISPHAQDLICCILRTDPRARPSPDEILTFPWFQNNRLPPPVPSSVANFAGATPRTVSNASVRSETPERPGMNFGRIDSPAPRFPLRDLSPAAQQNVYADAARGQSLPIKPVNVQQASPACGAGTNVMTPGRCPSGGLKSNRPPTAVRGNDENAVPHNNHPGDAPHAAHTNNGRFSPASSRGNLGTPISATPLQVQQAGCGIGIQPVTRSNSIDRVVAGAAAVAGTRGNSNCTQTPRKASTNPYSSARSRTSSPRRSALLGSARTIGASLAPTPKENLPVNGLLATTGTNSTSGIVKTSSVASLRGTSTQCLASSARNLAAPDNGSSNNQPPLAVAVAQPTCQLATASPRIVASVPAASGDVRDRWVHNGDRLSPSPAMCATPASGFSGQPDQPHSARLGCTFRRNAPSPVPDTALNTPGFAAASSCSAATPATQTTCVSTPELWIVKWVDYSSKYGVGYMMSDKSIGVYFNDSTKIILTPDGSRFDYITRRTQEYGETRTTHTFEDYPEDLRKKTILLRHFQQYMVTNSLLNREGATMGASGLPLPEEGGQAFANHELGQAPYVKKWTRNKNAVMFHLSNRIVQVVFHDKTETILSSQSNTVTFIDKLGKVSSYPLSNALEEVTNPDLAKRLRYARHVLQGYSGSRTTDIEALPL